MLWINIGVVHSELLMPNASKRSESDNSRGTVAEIR